jgi:uncharacterized protein
MKKKMVVIDTNFFVSAAIAKGYAYRIFQLFTYQRFFNTAYSQATLAEYRKVANYGRIANKYPLFKTEIDVLIKDLLILGTEYSAAGHFTVIKDSSDNKFLDLAFACHADYLITGNHLDFTITEFYQTKIVSPKMFWEAYEAGHL